MSPNGKTYYEWLRELNPDYYRDERITYSTGTTMINPTRSYVTWTTIDTGLNIREK